MSGRIQGRVAVVTGGSSGIGFATAALFAQEGARVFVTGRHTEELADAASRLGPGVIPVPGDVTKNGDLERLYETVKREAGQIDILFATAVLFLASPDSSFVNGAELFVDGGMAQV